MAVVLLPFLPALPTAAWPYVLISSLLNGVFFILVAEAYAHGGIALAYPLMRGVAPMMTLVTSWLLLGEVLPTARLDRHCGDLRWRRGVGAAPRRCRRSEGGAFRVGQRRGYIRIYTERCGRRAGLAHAVDLHAMDVSVVRHPDFAVAASFYLTACTERLRKLARGICGAGASIGAYTLVLWAMTRAPVAPVAALRETSILLGVVLARLFLGERPGRRGWSGAVAIAAGAALLRLAPG